MINNQSFRPWGSLNWMLNKIGISEWNFFGCLSTEERSWGALEKTLNLQTIKETIFWEIIDPIDSKEHTDLRDENRKMLTKLNPNIKIETHQLMEPVFNIFHSTDSFLKGISGNLILDISTFPKRFFFPIMRMLIQNEKITNLLIVYSNPITYAETSLAENPQGWNTIPPFISNDDQEPEVAIVGVGFMPLGLPEFVGNDGKKDRSFNFLFPFPPGPPSYQRTLDFVRKISDYRPIRTNELHRVDPMSIPDVFDKICAITDFGRRKALFAPFGPKTISLAMCLHAIQSKSAVYYTQPTYYSPNYSSGCFESFAYSIKVNGNFLYKLYDSF